jgi:hypothetical protein
VPPEDGSLPDVAVGDRAQKVGGGVELVGVLARSAECFSTFVLR